jgi:arylsulfatase A-like enzyme
MREYYPKGSLETMSDLPNILFISIDDLNDWVGVLGGYPGVKTPNIDRFAERGTLFSNAHTPVPVCNGARTAVLTGLSPNTTGIYSNYQDWRLSLSDVVTLPEYFRDNGYEVVGAGKNFHGQFDKKEAFDLYFNHGGSPKAPRVPSPIQFGPVDGSVNEMSDFKVANFAKKYLSKQHNKPFFFSLGFVKPHVGLNVPQKFFDLYPLEEVKLPEIRQDDLKDVPNIGKSLAQIDDDYQTIIDLGYWQEIVRAYLASISFVDEMIGLVLDSLYSSSYADNTIVVLWSDNGWHLGEKLHWKKETLWEEATRIPLIISAPNIAESGEVSTQAVSLLDLYPTLLELAGLSTKSELEGESLVPLLKEPNAIRETPAISFWEHSFSVRTERWRYIQYFDGSEELYDHDRDSNEWTNLAGDAQYEDIKKELSSWLPPQEHRQLGDDKDNILKGNGNDDVLFGLAGNDYLVGKTGDDQLFAMKGNDTLSGGGEQDFLLGGEGSNLLKGGGGDDILAANEGNDTLQAGRGQDVLFGGKGNDELNGGGGNDSIYNHLNIDTGDGGDDVLKGNRGNDLLIDDLGDDTLMGGRGKDTLSGGSGSDVFVFESPKEGVDTIADFVGSDDTLFISAKTLGGGLTAGVALKEEQLAIGSQSNNTSELFIYNTQTGNLFFDPDGSGPKEQVKIAILTNQTLLSAKDIFIIA